MMAFFIMAAKVLFFAMVWADSRRGFFIRASVFTSWGAVKKMLKKYWKMAKSIDFFRRKFVVSAYVLTRYVIWFFMLQKYTLSKTWRCCFLKIPLFCYFNVLLFLCRPCGTWIVAVVVVSFYRAFVPVGTLGLRCVCGAYYSCSPVRGGSSVELRSPRVFSLSRRDDTKSKILCARKK